MSVGTPNGGSGVWRVTLPGRQPQVLHFAGKVTRQEVEWLYPGATIEPTSERKPVKKYVRQW